MLSLAELVTATVAASLLACLVTASVCAARISMLRRQLADARHSQRQAMLALRRVRLALEERVFVQPAAEAQGDMTILDDLLDGPTRRISHSPVRAARRA